MTGRWSSQVKKMEFKDLQANTMAVDSTGRLCLLAGRRALGIVNLSKSADTPDTPEVKKIPRQSKWEISAAQWNPHASHSNIFITACNQRADIWTWDDAKGISALHGSLKAHTRVISDLDWSPKDTNLVATCSGDAYAFLWDVRDTKKPAVSMQAVVGASQVKWNRVNTQLLATAHDGDIRIWDPRKSSTPMQYIAAHLSKIHGLDWSPTKEFHLASSSQDCTVKLWDITNPKVPESKLTWNSPVWRARYTPSGEDMATVMVPQLRRGENSLLLWQLSDTRQPIHTFMGHQDVVLEFQWRRLHEENEEYQLVSWSRDQSLRLWKLETQIDKVEPEIPEGVDPLSVTPGGDLDLGNPPLGIDIPHLQNEAHTENGSTVRETHPLPVTPPMSSSLPRRDEMQSPHQPKTLEHEFKLVNFDIPNVSVESMDAISRTFTATAIIGTNMTKLMMCFPDGYPNNQPPHFQFDDSTTVDSTVQDKLRKVLEHTSLQHVRHNRSCIEPCLRQLVNSLEELTLGDSRSHESYPFMMPKPLQNQRFLSFYPFPPGVQEPVPFPRTCGARFCGAGFLVCFTKAADSSSMRRTSSTVEVTPRTMSYSSTGFSQGSRTPQGRSALGNLFSIARSPPTSDGMMGYHREHSHKDRSKQRSRSKSRAREPLLADGRLMDKKAKTGPVVIYNISCLLPVSKQLAEGYHLGEEDIPAMCKKNANLAAAAGRKDLVQVWSLAALTRDKILEPDPDPDKGQPWAMHPFGRKLINSLINHYSLLYDVQTLAMLSCVFGNKFDPQKPLAIPKPRKPVETVPNGDTLFLGLPGGGGYAVNWGMSSSNSMPRIKRSNSWSSLSNDIKEEAKDPSQIEREKHEQNMSLLEPSRTYEYDQYKRAYAEILYRWQLFNKRADVLQYLSTPAEPHKGIEFGADCQHCHQEVRGAQCWHCKNYVLQCVICHMSVKGTSSFCLACGHGGHTSHLMDWFRGHSVCPTGCGCVCLEANPMTNMAYDDT